MHPLISPFLCWERKNPSLASRSRKCPLHPHTAGNNRRHEGAWPPGTHRQESHSGPWSGHDRERAWSSVQRMVGACAQRAHHGCVRTGGCLSEPPRNPAQGPTHDRPPAAPALDSPEAFQKGSLVVPGVAGGKGAEEATGSLVRHGSVFLNLCWLLHKWVGTWPPLGPHSANCAWFEPNCTRSSSLTGRPR